MTGCLRVCVCVCMRGFCVGECCVHYTDSKIVRKTYFISTNI
ncbi:hypothetical protein FKM82_030186 [Ascaphus truei]